MGAVKIAKLIEIYSSAYDKKQLNKLKKQKFLWNNV